MRWEGRTVAGSGLELDELDGDGDETTVFFWAWARGVASFTSGVVCFGSGSLSLSDETVAN